MGDSKTPPLVVSNKLYDGAKYFTQVILPALGALYVALAALWNFPKPQEVGGTILAIDTFLGVVLHISTKQYERSEASSDGVIDVETTPMGVKQFQLALHSDPNELDQKDKVVFKVNSSDSQGKHAL